MKEYTIKINGVEQNIKNIDKLRDSVGNLEVQTIKAVSAQELWQEISEKSYKQQAKDLNNIIPSIAKIVPKLEEISKMNTAALSTASTLTTSRLKQIDEEIKSLKKIPQNILEINKAYEAKEKIIIQQSEISRKKALEEVEKLKAEGIDEINIEQEKAYKLQEIDKKLKEDLKKNSDELKKVRQELLEPVKNSKGFIDIDATKENIQAHVDALEKYKNQVQKTANDIRREYDYQILMADGNKEQIIQLEKEKETAAKKYAAEVKKINEEIAKTEDKSNSLRLKQFQGYLESASKLMEGFKKTADSVGDYFTQGFSAVSNIYNTDIKDIDGELTQLKVRKNETDKESTANSALIAKLKDDLNAATEAGNQEAISSINERISSEEELTKKILIQKNKLADEEAQLELKKAKKQAEQEKIEKLNRKATLIKEIGTATANVAQGVTKAWAFGPILGPVLAAVVATAGAIQIGIMTKQLAKFEDGGLLNGKQHAQGGMRIEGSNIEVEGGEYVVNRVSTDKNIDLIRYINSQRRELTPTDISAFFAKSSQGFEPPFSRAFETGGQLPAITAPDNIDNETLVEAIRSIRIEPRVSVTDIDRVKGEMVSVDNWVGL
ncbi:MAG: hypothetical protein LBV43_05415 [Prevotella sp.]|nr:hypothetical protein [Prevotella sp.]